MTPEKQNAHLMLTVLGTNPRPANYTLSGQTCFEAQLAPVALFMLLPEEDRPNRLLALCTSQAHKESWSLLKTELESQCHVEYVKIPDGNEQEDTHRFLEVVTSEILNNGNDAELTVDVTHGFRHFSFLTYISVLYVAALHKIRIRGAYYGMLNKQPAMSPFLDLRSLLELPRWVHALQVLRETGSTLPITELLDQGKKGESSWDIADNLKKQADAYLMGLPLELGWAASDFQERLKKPLGKLLRKDHRLPLADDLLKQLEAMIDKRALKDKVQGDGWKGRVSLSEDELLRQADIIDELLNHGHTATAVRLMDEWTVSWIILCQGVQKEWLGYHKARKKAAGLLHALVAINENPEDQDILHSDQKALARFWQTLSDLRNGYSHQGMRGESLVNKDIDNKIETVCKYWACVLKSLPDISLSFSESTGGRVLVSPIGLRPGVLFSAVKAASGEGEDLDTCLVICSEQTEEKIGEALERAGFSGSVEALRLNDAVGGGIGEIEFLVNAARKHLICADEVIVNVTGGTTLMGLAAEGIATAARRYARPTRRFGLIDRRSTEQQDADTYQIGEPFWLDTAEDDNGNYY